MLILTAVELQIRLNGKESLSFFIYQLSIKKRHEEEGNNQVDAADTGIGYLCDFDGARRYELHGRLAQRTG